MGLGAAAGPPGRTPTTATQSNPEAHVEVTVPGHLEWNIALPGGAPIFLPDPHPPRSLSEVMTRAQGLTLQPGSGSNSNVPTGLLSALAAPRPK